MLHTLSFSKQGYNLFMGIYRFFHPVEVRYGDLDPQGHVNNATYLTYMEQARTRYLHHLGLWDGRSFMEIGIILAEVRVTFRSPVVYGQPVRVGARVSKIGRKSLTMEYCLEDGETQAELANGEAVLVAYDYRYSQPILVPDSWRRAISEFEENASFAHV
jgi:acyl-CoA thioester hydrolase